MTFITVINDNTFSNPEVVTSITGEFFGDFSGDLAGNVQNATTIDGETICASSQVKVDNINEFTSDTGILFDVVFMNTTTLERYKGLSLINEIEAKGLIIWEKKKIENSW